MISTFLNTSNFSQIRPSQIIHNALHTLFFFLYYPRNPSRAAHMYMGVSHSLELGQLRTGHALKRTDSPIFTSYQLPIAPPGLRPPELFHHPHWDVTWRGRVQAAAATVSSWVQWSCRVRKTHLYSSPNLWFLQFLQSFCPLLSGLLWALEGGDDIDKISCLR